MNLFDLAKLEEELHRTNKEIEQEDFWNNIEYAQKVMKEKKSMEDTINTHKGLETGLSDIEESKTVDGDTVKARMAERYGL